MPDSFLGVRVQAEGDAPVVRALQTSDAGAFKKMPSLTFTGEYPLGTYRFQEPALPVEVSLEVFNPFIPMDLKASAIPCAIYTVTAKNPTDKPVAVDVLAAQTNALGFNEGKGKNRFAFGQNQNELVRRATARVCT